MYRSVVCSSVLVSPMALARYASCKLFIASTFTDANNVIHILNLTVFLKYRYVFVSKT